MSMTVDNSLVYTGHPLLTQVTCHTRPFVRST